MSHFPGHPMDARLVFLWQAEGTMNRQIFSIAILLTVFTLSLGAQGKGRGQKATGDGTCPKLAALPIQPLTETEQNDLLYMRQEEKLARDVYRGLSDKWGSNVFSKLKGAEQRHMDSLKGLITRYQLQDPVKDDTAGVFSDAKLSALYKELMAKGSESVTEALKVGAKIEDMDIHSLDQAISRADNDDLKLIYGNLNSASYNHIRNFHGSLQAAGQTYQPQFISSTRLQEILAATPRRGQGMVNRTGQGRGNGQGGGHRGNGNRRASSL